NRKVYREIWWQYAEKQKSLYTAIAPLKRVLAIAQTSKTIAFAFSRTDLVFSNAVILLVIDRDAEFAVLQSNFHVSWVLKYVSTLKGDTRYIPTDCFETFP